MSENIDFATFDTGWQPLGYGTGFGAFSGGFTPAYRVFNGILFLRGSAQKTSGNIGFGDKPFGDLPVDARPSATAQYMASYAGVQVSKVSINTNGTITQSGASTASNWISIDGCSLSL